MIVDTIIINCLLEGKEELSCVFIEKGKFDPSLPLAFKAARLFKLSIEDIFQDEVEIV